VIAYRAAPRLGDRPRFLAAYTFHHREQVFENL
jgi:hypothetical protein